MEPRQKSHGRKAVWEAFCNDDELKRANRIKPEELVALSRLAMFGTLSSKEDLLFTLKVLRRSNWLGTTHRRAEASTKAAGNLPRSLLSQADPRGRVPRITGVEASRRAKAVRVLTAAASSLSRDVVRHHFQCAGCEVVAEAQNAAQAADLFRTVRPEVVALEVGLPSAGGTDSVELFRAIRKEAPDTSIIILTEPGPAHDLHALVKEGALDCIVEPFDALGFRRILRSLSSTYPELRRAGTTVPIGSGGAPT